MSILRSIIIILNVVLISGSNLFSQDQRAKIRAMIDSSEVFMFTDPEKAQHIANKALDFSLSIGDSILIADSYRQLGYSNYVQSNDDLAMNYYLKSLEIAKKIGNTQLIAKAQSQIGTLYGYRKDYDKALLYFRESGENAKLVNDSIQYGKTLKLLAWMYRSKKEYRTALEMATASYNLLKEKDPYVYIEFCESYYGLNDLSKATEYAEKYLKITIKNKDINGQSEGYKLNGRINYKKGKFKKALDNFNNGYICAEKLHATQDMMDIQLYISQTYADLHQFDKAYEHHLLYSALSDSVSKHSNIEEIQVKYEKQLESVVHENEIKLKESENRNQRLMLYATIGGLLILLGFSIIILRMFSQKRKANIVLAQQKEEITTQRDEIEAQRDLVTIQKDHIEEQKKEITDSINYAKRIQEAVLPSGEYANNVLGDHFILFKPRDIVSGDFYWATQINDWQIFTVADCTGHGVPGAFMSMLGISFLNEIVRKKEVTKAGDVLDQLRDEIINALQQRGISGEQKDGMDISLCVLNKTNHILQFAGANNPLIIVSGKELKEIEPDNQPVAIYENMKPFTNHEIQVNIGDSIYLTSDGYIDQFGGPNNKKFMIKRFKELLIEISDKPMVEQYKILDQTFNNWKGEHEQIDDVTVLGIKI